MIGVRVMLRRHAPQLRANFLRTLLTLLGMVFGVGSVVAMVSIGEGAQRQILATISALGANSTHIVAERVGNTELGDVVNVSAGLNRADVQALRDVIPGIRGVAFRLEHPLKATDLPVPASRIKVLGVSEDLFRIHDLHVGDGRELLDFDHARLARVAVIGNELAVEVFPEGAVGQVIRLDYTYFEIVGVLEERSTIDGDLAIDPNIYNRGVLLPYEAMVDDLRPARVYSELDLVSLETDSMEATLDLKRAVEPVLASLHGGVVDYEVIAPEEILEQRRATQSVLNIVLICIAAISLLVGGIGVMNIMLANIMERVGEIGLRRAVGAHKRHIRNQFLTEAVLICFVGGVIGIVMGFGISLGVALFAELPIAFAWESMIVSFVISVSVGLIFGLVPALRAANLNPIEALHA